MSADPIPSNDSHGHLDEQISHLMQCKPLSEQEVLPYSHPILLFVFEMLDSAVSIRV